MSLVVLAPCAVGRVRWNARRWCAAAVACIAAAVLLAGAAPARADTMEDESVDIVRRMDHDPNLAVRDAEQALRAALTAGDRAAQLRAWRILAVSHTELLDMAALNQDIAQGEKLAIELGHVEARCQFLAARGAVERNAARYAESDALYDQAIALATQHGRERMRAQLYLDKSLTPLEQGRTSDTMALLLKAQAIFEARGDRFGTAVTLDSMGSATQAAKASAADMSRAIGYHLQALSLLDPAVNRASVLTVHYNLGIAYYTVKDNARSRQHMQLGLAMARRHEGAIGAAYYEFNLAKIERDDRHFAKALAYLDAALPEFRKRGDLKMMVFGTLLTRADVRSRMGREAEALHDLQAARAMLPGLNSPTREVRFHEAAATIHARLGQYEPAYRELLLSTDAEQRRAHAANGELAAELKARFDLRQKDSENALLRAQHEEASARRLVLFLALLLCLVLLGVGAFFLYRQVRRSRRYAALAMRDELTGLPNRRSIGEFARLQWNARSAHEGRLRVALLDIDHFKRINDEFGHDTGDAVLTAFAQACSGRLRSSDRLGRYGGEEFLLIMPGSDASFVPVVFQRLQQAVRDLQVPGAPAGRRLSFSMGVAEALGENDTLHDMIHRADQALYRAKQNGRDRCEVAPPVRLAASTVKPRQLAPAHGDGSA